MATNTYPVYAANDWTTLFGLGNGEIATMTASGTWTWDDGSGRPWCGPGGNGVPAPGGSPEPGAQGCLIWRIYVERQEDGQDIVEIPYHTYFSSNNQSYQLNNVAGAYQFRINDDSLNNKAGFLQVTVVTP